MKLIPRHRFQGTPREVGRQHGAQLKPLVRKVVESLGGNAAYTSKREYARRMEDYLRQHFPEIIEEFEGIAEGAGISVEEASALSITSSLIELPSPHMCSSIAWNHPTLGPFVFKTDDGPGAPTGEAVESVVQRRLFAKVAFDIKTTKSHRCLGVTDAGRVWLETGLNEHGLCMGHSSGRPPIDVQDGYAIPQHMFPGLVLRYCRNADEVEAFARKHPVTGKGVNIACADTDGNLIAVEKCAGHTGIRRSREWAFTTNHYQDEKLWELVSAQVPKFISSEYYANSHARELFLKKQLPAVRSVTGKDPRTQLEVLLADGPGRICQCFDKDKGLWTNYACFLNPATRTMEVYLGPHERKPHATYSLT